MFVREREGAGGDVECLLGRGRGRGQGEGEGDGRDGQAGRGGEG